MENIGYCRQFRVQMLTIKKQFFSFLLPFIAIIFLFSCEFSPSGYDFKEIDNTFPQNLEIELSDEGDEIYVWGKIDLTFNIDLKGREIETSFLSINDDRLVELGKNNSYELNSTVYPDGNYILGLDIVASSGTGSLAAAFETEFLLIQRQWLIIINNSPPDQVKIASIKPDQGTLEIDWLKCSDFNFQEYNILKKK